MERRLEKLGFAGGDIADGPDWVAALVDDIRAYAEGEPVDFSTVPVDLAGVDDFRLAIYGAARRLGFGETTTYGELAGRAGHAGLSRETGQALGSNPVPLVIPCHRILAAGGRIGGFSAPGGVGDQGKDAGARRRAGRPAARPAAVLRVLDRSVAAERQMNSSSGSQYLHSRTAHDLRSDDGT